MKSGDRLSNSCENKMVFFFSQILMHVSLGTRSSSSVVRHLPVREFGVSARVCEPKALHSHVHNHGGFDLGHQVIISDPKEFAF